jgi:hypothetical protein
MSAVWMVVDVIVAASFIDLTIGALAMLGGDFVGAVRRWVAR